MANLYGVANPLPLPVAYGPVGAADVTCPAGAETTVVTTGAVAAISNGFFYPVIQGVLFVVLGATAPSALQYAFKLGSGSDVVANQIEPGLLVALAELTLPIVLIGASSQNAWKGAGSTINVTLAPTGQAVTLKVTGSQLWVSLQRGPDA
jgi:hypothetical protein